MTKGSFRWFFNGSNADHTELAGRTKKLWKDVFKPGGEIDHNIPQDNVRFVYLSYYHIYNIWNCHFHTE